MIDDGKNMLGTTTLPTELQLQDAQRRADVMNAAIRSGADVSRECDVPPFVCRAHGDMVRIGHFPKNEIAFIEELSPAKARTRAAEPGARPYAAQLNAAADEAELPPPKTRAVEVAPGVYVAPEGYTGAARHAAMEAIA